MMIPVRYGGIMKYRLLNDGWEFTLSDTKEHIELGMNTSLWREVKIPHDWSVEYDYEKDHPIQSISIYDFKIM